MKILFATDDSKFSEALRRASPSNSDLRIPKSGFYMSSNRSRSQHLRRCPQGTIRNWRIDSRKHTRSQSGLQKRSLLPASK